MMNSFEPLPQLCVDSAEVARILRISRAMLYQRSRVAAIKTHKGGRRTFVTVEELSSRNHLLL
jgi:hypothetical protein